LIDKLPVQLAAIRFRAVALKRVLFLATANAIAKFRAFWLMVSVVNGGAAIFRKPLRSAVTAEFTLATKSSIVYPVETVEIPVGYSEKKVRFPTRASDADAFTRSGSATRSDATQNGVVDVKLHLVANVDTVSA